MKGRQLSELSVRNNSPNTSKELNEPQTLALSILAYCMLPSFLKVLRTLCSVFKEISTCRCLG